MTKERTFRFAEVSDASPILDFIKGLATYEKMADLVVADEAISIGCAGREISALLRAKGIVVPTRSCNIGDCFVEHGNVKELYRQVGIDARSLADKAKEVLGR